MIPFVRDIQFEYGACDLVSPLIRRVVANNPGPFTFKGTVSYIVGRGRVAIMGCFASPRQAGAPNGVPQSRREA